MSLVICTAVYCIYIKKRRGGGGGGSNIKEEKSGVLDKLALKLSDQLFN